MMVWCEPCCGPGAACMGSTTGSLPGMLTLAFAEVKDC